MTACRKPCCTILPQRWVFAVMGSLGIMNVLAMRVCLSLAITKIVTAAPSMLSNGTISHETCPAYESKSSITSIGDGYEWDEYTQGIILSSFFWGYIVTQLPGGILSANFGGKYVLGLGILSTALCTVWTPTVIRAYDATGLIVIRVLTGLGEGMTKPAVYALIGQWAPPHERSRMSSLVLAGTQLGTIVGTSLSGVLIQHSSIGWPMPFYVLGGIGITWFFVWVILGYNNPDVHPFITEKEKKFLHETMNEHTHRQIQPTPWRSMLTSAPLWAMVVAKFGREWGCQMMVTDLPKYMSNVLKFSIKANGFLTALPSFAMWTIGISSSWLADWLIKHGKLSRTNVRRIFVTISSLGPAIFMILASYAGCDYKFVVTLFTVSMGFMGSSYSGVMANLLDLSPNYSGIMGAVGTTVGGLSGMMVPYVVGLMTPNQTLSEWRIVFWITVMIFCTAALIFDLWGDGEVQYWNNPVSQDDTEKELERKEEMPIIGIILSSFFWGFTITQIPGGLWATKYGGKYVLGLGILFSSIFTFLIPLVVKAYDATGLIVLRVLTGLSQGPIIPAVTILIAQWAPPHERSKISTVVMTGGQLGIILGTALPGVFIQYFSTGWSMVLYFLGGSGILCFFAWVILCYSTPDVHPFISDEEKKYLHETMNKNKNNQTQPTPWQNMLFSAPLWALLVAKFGRDWCFQLMVFGIPKYMSSILKFSIQENGFLSALPNVVTCIVAIIASWLADWSIKGGKLSRTNVRKICNTISALVPAVFIIAASYAGRDRILFVVYLTVGMGLMGPCYSGIMVNPIDLSPNHSGTLTAIVNVVGSLAGILAPYSVGVLTPSQTLLEWRIVFWISFAISCVANLIFVCWADGEVQYWLTT